MEPKPIYLEKIQQLVVDIQKVERNHCIPGTDRHENVAEHSLSVAMLCWMVFESVKPPLDFPKILKYALVHDFPERGLESDTNTHAGKEERAIKKERETAELQKINGEFEYFADLIEALNDYEELDEEALFVWSVDKIQAIILGKMDNWRPYKSYGVTYKQFCDKIEEFISESSLYVKDIFGEVFEDAKKTYYDNPDRKI